VQPLLMTVPGQGTAVKLAGQASAIHDGMERRSKPRICEFFPVMVHGVDGNGEAFETATVLDNLSTDGLYMRIGQSIQPGATLSMIIQFATSPINGEPTARAVIYGVVLRAELTPSGACGVAIKFSRYQFL
jgi:hypothetical protein